MVAAGVVAGAVGIAYGISLIADRGDASVQGDTGLSSGGLLAYGLGSIVVGGILIGAAVWLVRGSRLARWVVGWFTLLNLFQGVAIVFQWYDVSPWEGIVSIALSALVLYLLFVALPSRAFYRRD